MGWARQQADKAKINKILRRCKNTKHADKRKKLLDKETRNEAAYR
jgi:hypothetical protein